MECFTATGFPMEVLTGYFDDSGSHAASEWYVLAGFVAPVSEWQIISDKWTGTLKREGIAHFKMREAMALDGQFKSGWTVPLRNQLIMKLVGIIEDLNPPRIECFLRRSEFDAFVAGIIRGSAFNDPYFILFYHLILSLAVNKDLNWSSDCTFVFDDQGKVGTDALTR
jgi:hypothetical protein